MITAVKTLAVAATLVIGSASASMAGSVWAWADGDAYVFNKWGKVVDTLYDGEKVEVLWCKKGICEIEHKGPDGLVKKHDLDFKKKGKKYWDDYGYDSKLCIKGKHATLCFSK